MRASPAEQLFDELGQAISGNEQKSMFGKPCYNYGRKPFIMFFDDELVCKLFDEIRKEAIQLKGTSLFDPSGKGKPMKNWIQLPFTHKKKWEHYAQKAFAFVQAESEAKKE